MPAKKKTASKRKYGKAASKYVESAVKREKKGTLKIGRSNKTVKSRKQAIAIGLSEAREKGAKVPKAPKKKTAPKKTTSKSSTRKLASKKSSGKKSTDRKSTSTAKRKNSSTKRKTSKKKS